MSTREITAHRGAMSEAPENTMAAFRRAVELGVDEIELDVHFSADGHLAVMHDATVDRTTDGTGRISDTTWEQLQRLDAGRGERVPNLEQVLDSFPGMPFQIEVKDVAVTQRVLEVIEDRRRSLGRVTVTSFHLEAVEGALQPDRWWRVGLICGRDQAQKVPRAAALGVDCAYLHENVLASDAVIPFRERGGQVYCWPARDEAEIRRALAADVTGFTTDDPALALRQRDRQESDFHANHP